MTILETLQAAKELEDSFGKLVKNLPRTHKGVRASEILFLASVVQKIPKKRFIESGTAGGQSTIQLALAHPKDEIISIDLNEGDSYAQTAQKRLQNFANVKLLYGDSQKIIPDILQKGDIVIIDGPKSFKALRFAFQLLKTGKPAVVFIHDMSIGTPERKFLENNLPQVFFSDNLEFAENYSYLDKKNGNKPKDYIKVAPERKPEKSYGATFACLPASDKVSKMRYGYLILKRGIWRWGVILHEMFSGKKSG